MLYILAWHGHASFVTTSKACPGAEYAEHTFRWDDEAQAGMGKRARDSKKKAIASAETNHP